MMRIFPLLQEWKQSEFLLLLLHIWSSNISNGYQECLSKWVSLERGVCETTPGFENINQPNYIIQLDKTLYGLKQALRSW